MKRTLLCVLIAALILSALPVGALAAKSPKIYGPRFMYTDDELSLGEKIGEFPVDLLDWESSDESIATVADGVISSHASGRAIISAALGTAKAYLGLVVLPREVTVNVGEIISLPYGTKEKFYIGDKSVALVNKKGQIYGVQPGETAVGIAWGDQKMVVNVTVAGDPVVAVDETLPEDADTVEIPDLTDDWAGTAGWNEITEAWPDLSDWSTDPADWSDVVAQSAASALDCADETDQIVLVEYQSGSSAKLSIHEKQSGVWTELYSGNAIVGRNGIDKAAEGDGKTPTGTYNLTQPFGINADPGANMDYTQVDKYLYWCGTSGSEYYNQLVDIRETGRMYESTDEYLINYKGYYNYAMFIDYNASGEKGKGSCIFLHCKGSKNSTGGCIAVSETVMKNIIKWAKPGAKIVIQ